MKYKVSELEGAATKPRVTSIAVASAAVIGLFAVGPANDDAWKDEIGGWNLKILASIDKELRAMRPSYW